MSPKPNVSFEETASLILTADVGRIADWQVWGRNPSVRYRGELGG